MTDNVKRYGFAVHQCLVGGSPKPISCKVADSYQAAVSGGNNVNLGVGDVVHYDAAGTVTMADGAETTVELPYGIVAGVENYFDGTFNRKGEFVPGGSTGGGIDHRATRLLVWPAPWFTWSVEVDEATTATTKAAYELLINRNVQHINDVASTTRPNPKVDISGHAATAGFGWRIIGLDPSKDIRDYSETGVRLIVASNASSFAGSAATPVVGV